MVGLISWFRNAIGKTESAYDVIQRLLTPEVVSLLTRQTVEKAIAQVRAHLKLGQHEQATVVCERALQVLDASAKNASDRPGDIQFLRATLLYETGRLEESRAAYATIADGSLPVANEEIRVPARGYIERIRKRLQTRLQQMDEKAPHISTFYTCIKCGHLKLFLSAPCETCLFRPLNDDSIAASWLCSTDSMDPLSLLGVGAAIRSGKTINFDEARNIRGRDWFRGIADQILSSTDRRATRISDFTSCPRCKSELHISFQDKCNCGARLDFPPMQRLVVCTNLLIRQVEDRWLPPRAWPAQEWLAALVMVRYQITIDRRTPDTEMQAYLRMLPTKFKSLEENQDKGYLAFDEQGKAQILVKSSPPDMMFTVYATAFDAELRSMAQHFEACSNLR